MIWTIIKMNKIVGVYMDLQAVLHEVLKFVIYPLELMGVLIIIISSIRGFYTYMKGLFSKQIPDHIIKLDFARGLGIALEFLLASELLKTIIIGTLDELIILVIIMALRIVFTFVLHWEIKDGSRVEH